MRIRAKGAKRQAMPPFYRSFGTHIATALATVIDQCKQCRQDVRDILKTLVNVYYILWGMSYRILKQGWGIEEEMCR